MTTNSLLVLTLVVHSNNYLDIVGLGPQIQIFWKILNRLLE